tara:strand:+ start:1270 stop:2565 length:1296 start_codon:yes stop_codon:yes gene_type:complete
MKKITRFSTNPTNISSKISNVTVNVSGDDGAVFSLQIKDNSSPNKFYNFLTNTFTNTFTSENSLNNISISGTFNKTIVLPANSIGGIYDFLLFSYPEFETEISNSISSNSYFASISVNQGKQVGVRFSTSSDQLDAQFVGVGSFNDNDGVAMKVDDSAGSTSSRAMPISKTLSDTGDSFALGYKYTLPSAVNNNNSLADSLQPKDKDFFTAVTGQANGGGTNSTSMILNSVDGLVVGMSLVDIAESGDEEQSGALGVLTYPTITDIDIDAKTITLSAAPSWGDNKTVVFRAYGSDLISQSTGGSFSFDLTVTPVTSTNSKTNNFGQVVVNGDVSGISIAVEDVSGVSVGSKIIGSNVTTSSNANLITAVHGSGTPITVTGAQTIKDNTVLRIHGSSAYALIEGTMTVSVFPTDSVDVFYDIDRAFILATNS